VDEEAGRVGLQPPHEPNEVLWQGVGENDVPDTH
jgi:hypothetical protein